MERKVKIFLKNIESCTQCGNYVEIRNDTDFTHFLCKALGYERFQYGKIPEKCPL